MATKTKKKIKDSLKNVFINELKDKNEEERLERIKENSKLKEFILYTQSTCPYCKTIKELLASEGMKYTEITQEENPDEWDEVVSITGMGIFPTALINENYLVARRDFNQPQQLIQAIQYLGKSKYNNPSFEKRMIEQTKTANYNMFTRINQISQQLNPIVNFITALQKELEEEEKEEEGKNE